MGSLEFKRFVADKILARHGGHDFLQRCNLRNLLNEIVVRMRQERDNVIDAKMHEPCSQLSVGACQFRCLLFHIRDPGYRVQDDDRATGKD